MGPTSQGQESSRPQAEVPHTMAVPWTLVLRATLLMVVTLVTTYLISAAASGAFGEPPSATALFDAGANEPLHFRHLGEWWRPATATLLHASAGHLLMNILWLTLLISLCARLGLAHPAGALAVAVLSAVGGEVASGFLGDGMSVGASGGIFGLVGIAFWRGGVAPARGLQAWHRWSLLLIGVLALVSQLTAMSAHIHGVDHAAHLVGLGIGILLARTPLVASSGARLIASNVSPEWPKRPPIGLLIWPPLLLVGAVLVHAAASPGALNYVRALDAWSLNIAGDLPKLGISGMLDADGRCRKVFNPTSIAADTTTEVECRLVPHQIAVFRGPAGRIWELQPRLAAILSPKPTDPEAECQLYSRDGEFVVAVRAGTRTSVVLIREQLWNALPNLRRLATSDRCRDSSGPSRE